MSTSYKYTIDPTDFCLKEQPLWWGEGPTFFEFSIWGDAVEYNIAKKLTARGIEKESNEVSLVRELKGEDTIISASITDELGNWREMCGYTVSSLNFCIKNCESMNEALDAIADLYADQIEFVLSINIIRLSPVGGMIDRCSCVEVVKLILKELVDFEIGGDISITPEFGGYNVGVRGKGLLIPIDDINQSLKLAGIRRPNEATTHIAGYIYNRLWRHHLV